MYLLLLNCPTNIINPKVCEICLLPGISKYTEQIKMKFGINFDCSRT